MYFIPPFAKLSVRITSECGGKVYVFDLFENHLMSQLKDETI